MKFEMYFLEKIELTKNINEKIQIAKEGLINSQDFEKYIRLIYTEYNFKINNKTLEKVLNYDKNKQDNYNDIGRLAFNKSNKQTFIIENFQALKKEYNIIKKLDNDNLLEYLKICVSCLSNLELKWFFKLLNKKLKIGLSKKSFNKILKDLNKTTIK